MADSKHNLPESKYSQAFSIQGMQKNDTDLNLITASEQFKKAII